VIQSYSFLSKPMLRIHVLTLFLQANTVSTRHPSAGRALLENAPALPSWRTRQMPGNCAQGWLQDTDELSRQKHGYCGGSTPYELSIVDERWRPRPQSGKCIDICASCVASADQHQSDRNHTVAASIATELFRPRALHRLKDQRRFVLSENPPISFRIEAAPSTIAVACHARPMSPHDFLDSDTLEELWDKDDARASAYRRRSQACATARRAEPSRRLFYGSTRRPSLREDSTTGLPTSI
jgi:hypothetical protein